MGSCLKTWSTLEERLYKSQTLLITVNSDQCGGLLFSSTILSFSKHAQKLQARLLPHSSPLKAPFLWPVHRQRIEAQHLEESSDQRVMASS